MLNKTLLLGSAAALIAVSGAQAADLPVVEPVDYVRVCDAFGAGFHYIPGTETCLKFSGYVRAEIGGRGGDDFDENEDDRTFLNSKFELVINASSMTEIGMIVGQFAIVGENEGDVAVEDAWITIGENILVGREISRYDFGGGYGMYDGLYVDEGLNQFTFIMPFGNGFSATIGLEDGRDRRAKIAQFNGGTATVTRTSTFAGANTTTATFAPGLNIGRDAVYGGMEIPEVVASLRLTQGWGSAQVSGALHQIRSLTDYTPEAPYTSTVITGGVAEGVLDEDYGFAVQAGVELNIGAMTKFKVVAAYADGAMHYIGGEDYYEALVDVTTGNITDTLDGWYALAGLNHDFGGGFELGGQFSYHDFQDQAQLWQVGATATYEVVENLLVRVGGQYTDIDTETNVALGTTAGNSDNWEAKMRIQRNF